jgi:1-aminocyclopropane-1-carboxylate deaminase/D-cysteine desulfhydrase-like pyridoxal-dependent ACC family enzyme
MNLHAFTRLDTLPRDILSFAPTPLRAARELSVAVGLRDLWIKHDELLGFGFGGNKVRGMEFLLADARARRCDLLVTGAGPQSNHVRVTAAAAAHAGMGAIAVYWGDPPAELQGNLLLTGLLGAELRFTGDPDRSKLDRAIDLVAEAHRGRGRKPYPIPRGGACALGVLGHVAAVREFRDQCSAQGVTPKTVVMAVGSGGTLAGWLLGSALLHAPWRVHGISVSRPAPEVRSNVAALCSRAATLLSVDSLIMPADVQVHDEFIGPGYGMPSDAGDAAIVLAGRRQGVVFDPTYTGKAFAGLRGLVAHGAIDREGSVVFIHTGGEPALFAPQSRGVTRS